VIHGPVYGGGHNQMIRLKDPLAAEDWEMLALVPEEPGSARGRLEDAGVEVIALPLHRLRATPHPGVQARFAASLPAEVRAIRRLLRDRSVDLVQVHGPTNPHAAIAAHREGVAVVWQLYDTRTPMVLRRATMPVVTRLADVVMTTGMEVARVHPGALTLGERLVSFVPPVDAREFRPDPVRRESARAKLRLARKVLAIGTVGNLNPSKGLEHLIQATARVRDANPDTTLRILGARSPAHGGYAAALQAQARDHGLDGDGAEALFVDPGANVSALLPALDVFVLTSVPRSEGIPTVILEAMACGLPVVTTDVGAVREVVEDGATGLVVEPERPDAIAGAVLALIRDPDLRASFGAEGRTRVEQGYGIERCAEAHLRAYELARKHRARRAGAEEAPAP
jgi:glycosyltransferase involved in cell wall biosynthesis